METQSTFSNNLDNSTFVGMARPIGANSHGRGLSTQVVEPTIQTNNMRFNLPQANVTTTKSRFKHS